MAVKPKGGEVDVLLQRVADLVTATKMLQLLKPGSFDTACLALAALLHAQERDPLADSAVTPLATMRYVVPRLGERARNAVGSIACALINMQDAAARNPAGVRRELKTALGYVRSPARKARGRRKSKLR